MKNLLTTIQLFSFSLCLPLISSGQENNSFKQAQQTGKAQLTYFYIGANGFVSEDGAGGVNGLLVGLMEEFEQFVLENHNIKIESSYQNKKDLHFKEFLELIFNSSNGSFGLHTTTIKPERKKFMAFSPAFLNNISVLISHKNVPTLSELDAIADEFKGLKAYTLQNSTYEKSLQTMKKERFPDLEIAFTPSVYELLNEVLEDQNSFGTVDISFYLEYVKAGKPIKRHPVGDKGGEQYGIAMPLNGDWEPIISEFFNSGFLTSTEYRQLVIKHLGKAALRMIDTM